MPTYKYFTFTIVYNGSNKFMAQKIHQKNIVGDKVS